MGNNRIAHLVTDEKFVDYAWEWFEAVAPGGSDYFLTSPSADVRHIKKAPVQFVGETCFDDEEFIASLGDYVFVALHSLTRIAQRVVLRANSSTTFLWIGFGYDYYDLVFPDSDALLLRETKAIAWQILTKRSSRLALPLVKTLKLLRRMRRLNPLLNARKTRAIKRIAYFSPVISSEYELVRACSPTAFPKHVQWNYGTLSRLDSAPVDSIKSRGSILLGNSATLSNNHADAIDLLSRFNLGERKVVCPLSYGSAEIADRVQRIGYQKLRQNFLAVTEYMELGKYISLLSSCSHAIMYHLRQQGVGNVLYMLYMGAVVFLHRQNPVYSYCKNLGLKVYAVDELERDEKLLSESLPPGQVQKHQLILSETTGREACIRKTRDLIDTITFPKV